MWTEKQWGDGIEERFPGGVCSQGKGTASTERFPGGVCSQGEGDRFQAYSWGSTE